MIKTIGSRKVVAVEPFPDAPSAPQVSGGFALASADKSTLVPLRVACVSSTEYDYIEKGSTVYTLASEASNAFAKEIYQLGSEKFILLPIDRIVLYETPARDD